MGAHHRLPQPSSTPTLGQCEAEFSFIHDAKLADFRVAPSAAVVVSEQRRSSLPVPRMYRIRRLDRRAWDCSPVVTPMRRRPLPGECASLSAPGPRARLSWVTRCRMPTPFTGRTSKATVAEIVHSMPKQVAFHVSRCVPYGKSNARCTYSWQHQVDYLADSFGMRDMENPQAFRRARGSLRFKLKPWANEGARL